MTESDRDPMVEEQEQAAAQEAAAIGGVAGDEDLDPARRPVEEGGGGVAEGFEQAEQDLIDHASHGDQHSARMALYHQGQDEEPGVTGEPGEADGIPSTAANDDDSVEQARSEPS